MCSYLIGFWFNCPIAAYACNKAFCTDLVGDFWFIIRNSGLYWIVGNLEFRYLFQIFRNFIYKDEVNVFFDTLWLSCENVNVFKPYVLSMYPFF